MSVSLNLQLRNKTFIVIQTLVRNVHLEKKSHYEEKLRTVNSD